MDSDSIEQKSDATQSPVENTETGFISPAHPVVISASRATDIPRWYADWFINRLNKGFVIWTNPFNRKQQQVFFDKTRAIIFWSKDPQNLIQYLPDIDAKGIGYYFQFTLNDYENERLEPHVAPLNKRIATFRELSNKIGKEKVVWRYDPLILSEDLTVDKLLEKIKTIGEQIQHHTSKLVISFVDINEYQRKISPRLRGLRSDYREVRPEEATAIADGLKLLQDEWGISIATCAEKSQIGVDLLNYNITRNRCIDDDLLARLFPQDKKLMNYLQRDRVDRNQQKLSGDLESLSAPVRTKGNPLKDPGQRKECGCIKSKDIGQYNTCLHLCVYCYANTSDKTVKSRYERYIKSGKNNPEIIPGPEQRE
jgi:DNA repair photolyase